MIAGLVLTPTVKVLGTFTRMFCMDSAFCSGMLMVMGVRLMYEKSLNTGMMKAPPPWTQREVWPSPTRP